MAPRGLVLIRAWATLWRTPHSISPPLATMLLHFHFRLRQPLGSPPSTSTDSAPSTMLSSSSEAAVRRAPTSSHADVTLLLEDLTVTDLHQPSSGPTPTTMSSARIHWSSMSSKPPPPTFPPRRHRIFLPIEHAAVESPAR
jgi:hypothetical protein